MKRETRSASSAVVGQVNGIEFRRARCVLCTQLFQICRNCDRGNVYCTAACSALGRAASVRRAKKRERASACGRLNHRDHSRAHRRRASRRVGDQGSINLAIEVNVIGSDAEASAAVAASYCALPNTIETASSPQKALSPTSHMDIQSGARPALRCAFCQRCVHWERRRSGLRRRRHPRASTLRGPKGTT